MKASSIKVLSILFFAALFVGTSAFTIPAKVVPPKWEKLGQRKVDRRVDRDEIAVTARDGRFSKLKIGVRGSAINMHRCVIHFANGGKQEVNIRKNIPAGSATRVIDINGGKRVIKKVVFWYDTKGLQNKATVVLWGRH
jgi:hypothetical protein